MSILQPIGDLILSLQHGFVDVLNPPLTGSAGFTEFDEVLRRARQRTDISDHLPFLFVEALKIKPRLIVELGVRGGESTFVFERVARLTGARLVSVDIEDCSGICKYADWEFVLGDDIEFAGRFSEWCAQRGINSGIDVLFIDTSHLYEHTLDELRVWLPHCSAGAAVLFHDTNQRKFYTRSDGSWGIGWRNNRGVIRALESYFGKRFNEKRDFTDYADGWFIQHRHVCSGMTMLTKYVDGTKQ
ncbi:MAG: class I SAM-dependent methyltransferase [Verrucomicrobia bacterium]|nr:class I SAM-dependent methyltransferase [Verrucomicrobiota bacterium]MCF7708342.1 class I SAM-dependent methyltransferase [Verrucomicrobiota bacterium]